jgi:ABC-type transporter Mla subunit MlaD
MARGYSSFGRRRSGPSPRLVAILAGVVLVALVGAVFWLSGQAESRKPEQVEIRVEATNVAPQ